MSLVGRTLGHYRILEPLGRGGVGQVFVAEDTRLGRKVALKILIDEVARSPQSRARFEREARAAAALSHSNILAIHDFGDDNGVAYAVAELLEGATLRSILVRGPLAPQKALDYANQLIAGLSAAHDKGIVHRDIKPENLFIDRDGLLKILDFGLATHDYSRDGDAQTQSLLTEAGTVVGTTSYMSPEQVRGEATDTRSDIFAVGIVIAEMLTGRNPFRRGTAAETMSAILRDSPSETIESIPGDPAIRRILGRCLERDPRQRFQSARDLGFALAGASGNLPIRRSRTIDSRVIWLAAAAMVAALAGTAAVYFRSRDAVPAEPATARRLVVLPLENLGTADDAYFVSGLTDEITSRLASVPGFAVISKNSAIEFAKSGRGTKEAGVDLGVSYILSGSVRWDHSEPGPGRIRVTPQLVRVSDDTTVWTQGYDGVLSEIFSVQANIAERVARELNVAVSGGRSPAVAPPPTTNLDAYQAYLLGVYQDSASDRITDPENARVIQTFERVVALDPGFALAHARLSIGYSLRYLLGYDRAEARIDLARRSAEVALGLQPGLAMGHTAMGSYHYARAEYDEALREFELAQRSAPADSYLLVRIASLQRRRGQLDQAVASYTRALDLDPLSAENQRNLAATFFNNRQYDNAISHFDLSIAGAPGQLYAYWEKAWAQVVGGGSLAAAQVTLTIMPKAGDASTRGRSWVWLYTLQRDYTKALAAVDLFPAQGRVDQFDFLPRALMRANILRLMGRRDQARSQYEEARRILESERNLRPDDARVHSALAIALAGLGRAGEALREGQLGVDLFPPSKDASVGPSRIEDMARTAVMASRFETALDHIDQLLALRCRFSVHSLELDPIWDPLRNQPRYRTLVGRGAR